MRKNFRKGFGKNRVVVFNRSSRRKNKGISRLKPIFHSRPELKRRSPLPSTDFSILNSEVEGGRKRWKFLQVCRRIGFFPPTFFPIHFLFTQLKYIIVGYLFTCYIQKYKKEIQIHRDRIVIVKLTRVLLFNVSFRATFPLFQMRLKRIIRYVTGKRPPTHSPRNYNFLFPPSPHSQRFHGKRSKSRE